MSKELEALNWLLDNEMIYRGRTRLPISPSLRFSINAIQRLEAIENAKPSEALKCLHKIAGKVELADCDDYWEVRNAYVKVEKALLKVQEQEKENAEYKKVLEIIKEKDVDIIRIRHLIFESQKNPKYWDLRYYNEARVIDDEKLTQEEFELLKRCLG